MHKNELALIYMYIYLLIVDVSIAVLSKKHTFEEQEIKATLYIKSI